MRKFTGIIVALLVLLFLHTVSIAYGNTEPEVETGTIGGYAYSDGQYTKLMYSDGSGLKWTDRPDILLTYTAERSGRVYFTREVGDGERPGISGRLAGDSEWVSVSDGFVVEKGNQVQVLIFPGEETYNIVETDPYDDTYELVYTYRMQRGNILYELYYVEDGTTQGDEYVEAGFDYLPDNPTEESTVTFTSNSVSYGGTVEEYYWYINDEYVTSAAGKSTWSWSIPSEGAFKVDLLAVDSNYNEDWASKTITVSGVKSYTVLDTAFTTGFENNQPANRKTSFEYGEEVCFWMKLGQIKGSHKVYIEWETPRPNEIIGNEYIDIPSPTTQGETEWSEYIVTSSIKTVENRYELLFRDPGYWKVKVWIDGELHEYSFSIESSLRHEATLSKTKLTSGEEIRVEASLSFNGVPLQGVRVIPELFRNGQLFEVLPEIEVAGKGEYSFEKTAPVLSLDSPPTGPENWSIKLTPIIDPKYGDAAQELEFQVLPLWIELIDAEVVQITTAPYDMEKFRHELAADREAGIRVYYNWKGAIEDFNLPQIPARLECISVSKTTSIDATLRIDRNTIISDHVFTLPEGSHTLKITLDPDNLYIPSNIEGKTWQENAYAKEMKTLNLVYLPVEMDLDWSNPEQQRDFLSFVKNQADFIFDVYPLPDSKFNYRVIPTVYSLPEDTVYDSLGITVKKISLLSHLSKTQVFTDSKTVAILPNGAQWWSDHLEEGMAYALLYTNAVLVQNNAHKYVTAHEIGHTYGLYLLREQYNQYPEWGIEVTGLILKDGVIYDYSIPHNSNPLVTYEQMSDLQRQYKVYTTNAYCFMGRGIYNSLEPWACTETFRDLYLALRDPPQPVIYVSGLIYENHTVMADPWFTAYGEPDIREAGDFSIKCLDGMGAVLYQGSFGQEGYFNGFGFTVPYPDGTKTIQIGYGNEVIYSRNISLNPPTLSEVNVEEIGDRRYRITWEASDPDRESITSMVQYSYDGGETWISLCPETDGDVCEVDLNGLPGGSCVIKVYSTDGINTVSRVSNQFNVMTNQPIASIFYPLSNITYPEGSNTLEGLVYDIEDGVIQNPSWMSNIDGVLGTGSTIEANLSQGTHIITLSGTDDDGNMVQTQASVNVASNIASITSQIVCGGVDNGIPINLGDTFGPTSSVISYVTLVNASIGDQVKWIYTGPNSLSYTDNLVLEAEGDWNIYSELDLTQISSEQTIGDWTIEIYLNGEPAGISYFDVEEEPLTGFVWWGGFIGLAIIIGAALVGYMLLKRRKKVGPAQENKQPPVVQSGKQMYCSDCGQPATWIPQYERWYCYKCEKYLE